MFQSKTVFLIARTAVKKVMGWVSQNSDVEKELLEDT